MPSQRGFLLLYGSEKGQAESIAKDLVTTAASKGWEANLFVLNDIDRKFSLEKNRLPLVVITSTTGEGDWPENARKFERRIRRRNLSATHLSHINFSVLGLGDSNYTNFCECGKSLDRRLNELGAQRFYASAWADDGVGLDLTIDPWLEGLFPALDAHWNATRSADASEVAVEEQNGHVEVKDDLAELVQNMNSLRVSSHDEPTTLPGDEEVEKLGLSAISSLSVPPLPPAFLKLHVISHSPVDPCANGPVAIAPRFNLPSARPSSRLQPAVVRSVSRLTSPDAVKAVLHVRMTINDPEFRSEPGDSLGIVVNNSDKEVSAILGRLGVSEGESDRPLRLSIDPETTNKRATLPSFLPEEGATLRQLLRHFCDIRAPPDKTLLRIMAEHTPEGAQRRRLLEFCSAQGRQLFQVIRELDLSLMDILCAFPDCQLPVGRLLERLKQLQPRPYSSCSAEVGNEFEFAATVVNVAAGKHRSARRGVCTGWLADLEGRETVDERVWIYSRRNDKFRLPADLTTPIIMIGPGTGVAPFRAFMQRLEKEQETSSWIFFGCRHRESDWLFKENMHDWSRTGTLSRLSLAFSRDEESRHRYVQDCMRDESGTLVEWISDRKAVIYVCGDANNMAKDVRRCLTDILTEKRAEGVEKEGERLFARMRLDGRYLEDVWS